PWGSWDRRNGRCRSRSVPPPCAGTSVRTSRGDLRQQLRTIEDYLVLARTSVAPPVPAPRCTDRLLTHGTRFRASVHLLLRTLGARPADHAAFSHSWT